jgi:hypothetical protein
MRFSLLMVLVVCAGVLPAGDRACAQGSKKKEPRRFYVYSDAGAKGNHGEWTNFMPKEAGKMIKLSLVEKANPYSGSTCIRVDVQWVEPYWCGVVVASMPEYWGEKPGKGYNLRKAKKLVFHARGLKGGEVIQVKTAIAGDKRHGDSTLIAPATPWRKLTTKWQRFELDLEGYDLRRVITPFCFVTSKDYNPQPITFFLDEIYFEMRD